MNRTHLLRLATVLLVIVGAVLVWRSWQVRALQQEEAERAAALSAPQGDGSPIDRAFRPEGGPSALAPSIPGGNLYAQPGAWRDQLGAELTLAALRGRPAVFTFIYTACNDACPTIVKSMKAGLERVPAELRDRARWLVISIDPETDTPPVLAEYARKMEIEGGQWRLLTAPDAVVHAVAEMAGFHYQRIGHHFSHNAVIAVAGAEGEIVGWFADERIIDADQLGRGLTQALNL